MTEPDWKARTLAAEEERDEALKAAHDFDKRIGTLLRQHEQRLEDSADFQISEYLRREANRKCADALKTAETLRRENVRLKKLPARLERLHRASPPPTGDAELVERLIGWITTARGLHRRLKGRQRTETFYPGSLAPELMRRSDELLDDGLKDISAAIAALTRPADEGWRPTAEWQALLDGRDDFLVSKGLFNEFADTLPNKAPPPAVGETGG